MNLYVRLLGCIANADFWNRIHGWGCKNTNRNFDNNTESTSNRLVSILGSILFAFVSIGKKIKNKNYIITDYRDCLRG